MCYILTINHASGGNNTCVVDNLSWNAVGFSRVQRVLAGSLPGSEVQILSGLIHASVMELGYISDLSSDARKRLGVRLSSLVKLNRRKYGNL